jgi:peptidoglycan/xylan/chitin deacetylase (PgdA/CDA1 family)
MNSKVTVVMYHYVRDLTNSRYPELKGLDVHLFEEQVLYLKKNYNFITMEALINSINLGTSLPEKPVLLTFDDAYSDHFTYVFPILIKYGVQGSFFIPAKAIMHNLVLDVNKIHFILCSVINKQLIINDIYLLLNKYREEYSLEPNEYYFKKLANSNRFDSDEVIFIKRLLQLELRENIRKIITDELFKKYIGLPEAVFSRELYLSIDQIMTMKQYGMHIGSHGFDHYWLNNLDKKKQEYEIRKSIDFLISIGVDLNYISMCYPYGAYNDITTSILAENNIQLAFTTNVDIADSKKENRFTFSRLDTNDLPKDRNSMTDHWFEKA